MDDEISEDKRLLIKVSKELETINKSIKILIKAIKIYLRM